MKDVKDEMLGGCEQKYGGAGIKIVEKNRKKRKEMG